jgi:hypothetical protein
MNDRIDTLAAEAFQYASEHADESGKGSLGVFAEKFAELIVKECLMYTNPSPHEGTEVGRTLAWVDKNIKDHFGVK